ncbi:hypothetical protein PR048_024957 [Dryococelus australis]|uniref:Uncharacterized protein n=1 Tax=Dryococelus australis TaxID=614101 RepID=A0ABQ9GQ34_9NEOP|nr:hypothetical protein PR048_024957 [Dryococelus australis]
MSRVAISIVPCRVAYRIASMCTPPKNDDAGGNSVIMRRSLLWGSLRQYRQARKFRVSIPSQHELGTQLTGPAVKSTKPVKTAGNGKSHENGSRLPGVWVNTSIVSLLAKTPNSTTKTLDLKKLGYTSQLQPRQMRSLAPWCDRESHRINHRNPEEARVAQGKDEASEQLQLKGPNAASSRAEKDFIVMVLLSAYGATVAERLARSPPTKANRVQSPDGSPDFRKSESCRTMPLVGGFSRGSPVSPPLHLGAAPYSLQSPTSALKTSLLKQHLYNSANTSMCCSTLNYAYVVWMRTGRTSRRVGTGAARHTTDREECRIHRCAVAEQSTTSRVILQSAGPALHLPVSTPTIRRSLNEPGLQAWRPLRRLPSNPQHHAVCRQWCQLLQLRTREWQCIMSFDEYIGVCKVSWCLLTSVHSRCTQQETATTVQPRENIATTHKRAARDPLHATCGFSSQATFQWRKCKLASNAVQHRADASLPCNTPLDEFYFNLNADGSRTQRAPPKPSQECFIDDYVRQGGMYVVDAINSSIIGYAIWRITYDWSATRSDANRLVFSTKREEVAPSFLECDRRGRIAGGAEVCRSSSLRRCVNRCHVSPSRVALRVIVTVVLHSLIFNSGHGGLRYITLGGGGDEENPGVTIAWEVDVEEEFWTTPRFHRKIKQFEAQMKDFCPKFMRKSTNLDCGLRISDAESNSRGVASPEALLRLFRHTTRTYTTDCSSQHKAQLPVGSERRLAVIRLYGWLAQSRTDTRPIAIGNFHDGNNITVQNYKTTQISIKQDGARYERSHNKHAHACKEAWMARTPLDKVRSGLCGADVLAEKQFNVATRRLGAVSEIGLPHLYVH